MICDISFIDPHGLTSRRITNRKHHQLLKSLKIQEIPKTLSYTAQGRWDGGEANTALNCGWCQRWFILECVSSSCPLPKPFREDTKDKGLSFTSACEDRADGHIIISVCPKWKQPRDLGCSTHRTGWQGWLKGPRQKAGACSLPSPYTQHKDTLFFHLMMPEITLQHGI